MKINSNFSMNNISSLYQSLYQGSMSLNASKLSNSLFTNNNTQSPGAQLSSEGVKFVSNIRTSASSLSNVLSELAGTASSNRIVAISSNKDVVSIQHTGSRPQGVNSMTVIVDQLAKGQRNEGNQMNAEAAFEGSTGTNRFSIEMGGRTTQISVDVKEGDTNAQVQQRMADAINNAGAGVRATVVTDAETKASTLRLESTTTGTDPKNSFTITDTSGDLVARTGVGELTSEGQNAVYRVNDGPARTSQSNTVFIGNGVTATFNSESTEAAKITWGREASASKNAVADMVKNYNELYTAAAERTNDPRSQNLASRMLGIAGSFSGSLSSIGIGMDSSGRMTINSDRLNQAAENGRLDQFFGENRGGNFGFTNQMSRLADSVSRNPGNFISNSQFRNELMGNFGYNNFGIATMFNFFTPGSAMDFMF